MQEASSSITNHLSNHENQNTNTNTNNSNTNTSTRLQFGLGLDNNSSTTTGTTTTNGFLYYPDSNSNDSGLKSAEGPLGLSPSPSSPMSMSNYQYTNTKQLVPANFQIHQYETEPSKISNSSLSTKSYSYSYSNSSPEEESSSLSPPTTNNPVVGIDDDYVEPIDWGSDSEDDEDEVDGTQLPQTSSFFHNNNKSKSPPDLQLPSPIPPAPSLSLPETSAQKHTDPLGLLNSPENPTDPAQSLLNEFLPSPITIQPSPPTPIQLREVEDWEVERLHSEEIECLNGNWDSEGQFRKWHETYSVQTYGDENLLILPYTVIDF